LVFGLLILVCIKDGKKFKKLQNVEVLFLSSVHYTATKTIQR